jgi:tRNA-dihydrouridine synthase B
LAGYTDLPFRRSCRRHGCYYAFTPLIEAGAILYKNPRTNKQLCRGTDEPWLGVQILGSNPDLLKEATQYLNDENFDIVDLNMGCPVPKVTKRGAGAALSRDIHNATACARAVVENSRQPVTCKIRIVSEDDPEQTVELSKALAEAGIHALCIHGRVQERMYSGPVAVDTIRATQEALSIPVIANGGIYDRNDAIQLKEKTGCSRVMVARGAIGNPWIFNDISTGAPPPSHEALCDELKTHILEMIDFYGERQALRHARKLILAYVVGRGYRRSLRAEVTSIDTQEGFLEILAQFREEGPHIT